MLPLPEYSFPQFRISETLRYFDLLTPFVIARRNDEAIHDPDSPLFVAPYGRVGKSITLIRDKKMTYASQ